jgi:hypothetical protein
MRSIVWLLMTVCLAACGGGNAGSATDVAANAPALQIEPLTSTQRLGFSFKQDGFTPRPYDELFDTTLLHAYIGSKPGSFFSIAWASARNQKWYRNKIRGEMNSMRHKETSREQISFADGQGLRICFEDPDGDKGQFVLQDVADDQWFFYISCMAGGPTSAADYEVLCNAVDSFSTDMGKTEGATHIDKIFGFHVTLAGFTGETVTWKATQPMAWELKEGDESLGHIGVRMVRRKTDAAEYVKAYRDELMKDLLVPPQEEEIELAGRKGVRFKFDKIRSFKKLNTTNLVLYDSGEIVWHIDTTWYGESPGKAETQLQEAALSIKLPDPQ